VSTMPTRLVGIVAAVLFVAMAIQAAPLQPSIPTIQFTFSEASFKSVLAQWGPSGISRFKWHFAIDFPFLLSYGLFGRLLGQDRVLRRTDSRSRRMLLVWSLPIAAVLDGGENMLHLSFVFAAVTLPAWLYLTAGVIATAKWGLIVVFVVGSAFPRIRVPR